MSWLVLVGCKPVTTQADAEAWRPPAEGTTAQTTTAPEPPAPAEPPRPTSLAVALEGPFAQLDDGLAPRAREVPEDCEWEAPPPGPSTKLELTPEGEGPVLEVRLVRTSAHIACAPIEYCHLAVRTSTGWWLSPFDENRWCAGVVGTGASLTTEEEDVLFDDEHPERFVVAAIRETTRLEIPAAVSLGPGKKRASRPEPVERTSSDPDAYACEVTEDGTPWCQTRPDPLVP